MYVSQEGSIIRQPLVKAVNQYHVLYRVTQIKIKARIFKISFPDLKLMLNLPLLTTEF